MVRQARHQDHWTPGAAGQRLTQKLKPIAAGGEGYDVYLKKLANHHGVMVAAMKTKQSADPASVANLNKAIDELAGHY